MKVLKSRPIVIRIALCGLLLFAASSVFLAQAKGQPRLNVYFPNGFNDAAWQRDALDRVLKVWVVGEPPALDKKAVVIVTIERDGKVKEAKVSTESGRAEWDKAALETVMKAAPFLALPKSWSASTAQVHFHFEYGKL